MMGGSSAPPEHADRGLSLGSFHMPHVSMPHMPHMSMPHMHMPHMFGGSSSSEPPKPEVSSQPACSMPALTPVAPLPAAAPYTPWVAPAFAASAAPTFDVEGLLLQAAQSLTNREESMTELISAQIELGSAILKAAKKRARIAKGEDPDKPLKQHPKLGVIRLDYDYPPAEGDIDSPASYGYSCIYRVIPGLTFEMAQAGKFTEKVSAAFSEGIKYLEQQGASAITGDCGFMMAFQVIARQIASKPVFMSSMCQCVIAATAFDPKDKIMIMTANSATLKPQKQTLLEHCGFNVEDARFIIVGCQDVPGFDAVAQGAKVDIDLVTPGMVKKANDTIMRNPSIAAIILECTELPPYADALRAETGLPVWDAITCADFYINGFKDNPRFGIDDWQDEWDHEIEAYHFGDHLTTKDKEQGLIHKGPHEMDVSKVHNVYHGLKQKKTAMEKKKKQLEKKQSPILGIVRLDYNYPPAAGDIDCPASYGYDCIYRCVPGLTFEMAQAGKMTPEVKKEFKLAIKWLEAKGASGITGDCGFMMAFQNIARDIAACPVFMSSMVQCPMLSLAFDKFDKILILTANSETLKPQKDQLLSHCGFDVDDNRFVIRGCQEVPGFDAVALGEKVDVEYVTPGMVEMTQAILKKDPKIRVILLECTELPPYSDALRQATGLPVYDAITCADFFISAYLDNPRFGLNDWQGKFDGKIKEYKLGQNLSKAEKDKLMFAD